MKKWIIIISALFIVVVIGLITVYYNATKPLKIAEKKAIAIAKQETQLTDFEEFALYNGENTYFVLKAKNPKGEDVYVWIAEKDNALIIKRASDGVSKEEAVETVYANREPTEIISVRLGVVKIQKTIRPAWEIYYRTENGHSNYYYVDFDTGEKLRAIDNF